VFESIKEALTLTVGLQNNRGPHSMLCFFKFASGPMCSLPIGKKLAQVSKNFILFLLPLTKITPDAQVKSIVVYNNNLYVYFR